MYKWSAGSIDRMKGVNPHLVECATRALSKARYDYTIPWMGGVRNERQQNDIYKEGNSKCDGYKKISYHQTGNALDIIPVEKGYKNTRALNYMARLMICEWQIMLSEGLASGVMIWGGTFGSQGWDKPHFEIKDVDD